MGQREIIDLDRSRPAWSSKGRYAISISVACGWREGQTARLFSSGVLEVQIFSTQILEGGFFFSRSLLVQFWFRIQISHPFLVVPFHSGSQQVSVSVDTLIGPNVHSGSVFVEQPATPWDSTNAQVKWRPLWFYHIAKLLRASVVLFFTGPFGKNEWRATILQKFVTMHTKQWCARLEMNGA